MGILRSVFAAGVDALQRLKDFVGVRFTPVLHAVHRGYGLDWVLRFECATADQINQVFLPGIVGDISWYAARHRFHGDEVSAALAAIGKNGDVALTQNPWHQQIMREGQVDKAALR